MTQLVIHRADRFFSRLRGLLFSPAPAPGHALLLSPCASVHTAFMTYSIDVVFIDRGGSIMKVIHQLSPWRAAACAGAHQALELAAGEAHRLGLTPGMTVPTLHQTH